MFRCVLLFLSMLLLLGGCLCCETIDGENEIYKGFLEADNIINSFENQVQDRMICGQYEVAQNGKTYVLFFERVLGGCDWSISLHYNELDDKICLWKYSDYQSVNDIRISEDGSRLYYLINDVFPSFESKQILYCFDIINRRKAGCFIVKKGIAGEKI